MISCMKAVLAFVLLCAVPGLAQSRGPRVGTGSRVPSVTISFTQVDGGFSKFSIRNNSGHAVTAFAVLNIPKGVPTRKGRFVCQGKCSATYEVDDIAHPAIAAHTTREEKYETVKVPGGSIILESAIFDDGTYAGNERMAAYLVAQQLGNQQEFDRIVGAVDAVMSGNGLDTESKADRINGELGALPVAADAAASEAFSRWFPNVHDCSNRFAEIMESSASQERAYVEANWAQFFSNGAPSETALTQWWNVTEKFLAGYGCRECAAKVGNPNPPVKSRNVSIGCTNNSSPKGQGVWRTVELADDSDAGDSGSDESDQSAVNGGDAGGSSQNDTSDQLVMNSLPDDAEPTPAPASEATAAPVSIRPAPVPPKFLLAAATNAILEPVNGPGPAVLRRVPDAAIYQNYFYYVVAWTHYLLDGGTPKAAANAGNSPDPFPTEMNLTDYNTVTQVAYEGVRSLGDYMAKVEPSEQGRQMFGLTPENSWKPVPAYEQRLRDIGDRREDERSAIVDTEIAQLQIRLGKVVFGWLDARVHDMYHTVPGRLVREPLTTNQMVANYFRYTVWLNRNLGKGDTTSEHEKAMMRADEQKAAGLNDDEEVLLLQVSDDFRQAMLKNHSRKVLEAREWAGTTANPTALMPVTSDEGKRITEAHITELKSKLGEASFKRLDKRAHDLYLDVRIARVVPMSDEPPKAKESTRQVVAGTGLSRTQ